MSTNDILEQVVYKAPVGKGVLAPLCRWGYKKQLATNETPRPAYRAMRKLFGNDDPSLFESLVAQAAREHPLLDLPEHPAGVAAGHVDDALADLERQGYAVLGTRLPEAGCAELEAAARAASCHVIGGGPDTPARAVWDEAQPLTVRYNVDEEDLVQPAAAQRLLADESLLAVAQRYLGAAPVQDMAAMWWSAAPTSSGTLVDTDRAAQEFHFDLDRLSWLKVFVLLTDVDDETGPHVYARGSHRHKPDHLRHDGRMTDAEVEAAYPGEVVRLGGPRGTVLFVDTKGLHKGQALVRDHRLIFQVEFATSLFGAPYTRPTIRQPIPELRDAMARHPWTYQRLRLADGS